MLHAPVTSFDTLDAPTAALIRLSAWIAGGGEADVRAGFGECAEASVPARWLEELVLQSYLFAGFPRALNAAREWRRATAAVGDVPAPAESSGLPDAGTGGGAGEVGESFAAVYDWRIRGEEMCEAVYGAMYEKLRANIRRLHPRLDDWMIVEGYGKVLSRGGLDLPRRELCIVAACIAAGQDRQLHSHLHGARNAGVAPAAVDASLGVLRGAVPDVALERARLLWSRVRGK